MDKITEILVKADILFDFRPLMESIGFDKEAEILFVFRNKEKENSFETDAIPPSEFERSTALNSDNIYDAVLTFLNKTLVQFPEFEDEITKELGISGEGKTEVEIKVVSRKKGRVKQEFVLGWPRICRPCGFQACCWC